MTKSLLLKIYSVITYASTRYIYNDLQILYCIKYSLVIYCASLLIAGNWIMLRILYRHKSELTHRVATTIEPV